MNIIPIKQPDMSIFEWLDKEITRVSCVPKEKKLVRLTKNDFNETFRRIVMELKK